ncbi:MAG: M48 family metallopeptidase [Miltoncostaeaceae bacterium]
MIRSRWGSCSAAGRLSLSWRLLLAPEWIADHVVDHEVCHLVHLDHSPAFWSLLRAVDPRTDPARAWLTAHGPRLHDGPALGALAPADPVR